jgi:hypothetical protein
VFVDLTLASPKLWHDRIDFSAGILNIFDYDKGVPAFGEHINNAPGTIPPEGRRFSVTAHLAL